MERKLNHDDFDQFLKDNAESLRMKPSGAVWETISKELNRKKRRVTGLILLGLTLLSGGLFTWYTLNLPDDASMAFSKAENINKAAAKSSAAFPALNKSNSTPQPERLATNKKFNASTSRKKSTVTRVLPNQPNVEHVAAIQQFAADDHTIATEKFTDPAEVVSRSGITPVYLLQAQKNASPTGLHLQPRINQKVEPPAANTADVAAAVATPKKKRLLSWSIFATPTVSYRKLSENKTFERPFLTPGTPPMVSALYNINNAVIHKPDLGLELGIAAKYALTKKLKLRSGIQFNMSRYDIKAFSYVPEMATIALSNGFGVDSVQAVSSYRNFNGGRSNWLQNLYFQASLPVGLEYEVVSNKKVKWSVASAIQPTYVIGNRSYMITADYKNYARVPWLTRHWNMNTNVETFVTLQSGKTEWHVGPQMRYQVLSSFVKKYPVKENLFDFGMKVAITIK